MIATDYLLTVRPAEPRDLDDLMEVEKHYGEVVGGNDSTASRGLMESRIAILNRSSPKWFLITERVSDKRVVAYLILQPTNLSPDACISWSQASDSGALKSSFDPNGKHIFAVSFGRHPSAEVGALELVTHESLALWHAHKRSGSYYFCAGIRGLRKAHEETGISADDYWHRRREDGRSYQDQMLEVFRQLVGEGPVRLLVDGYPPDRSSMGNAVLYVVKDPMVAALILGKRMFRAGFLAGLAEKRLHNLPQQPE